jgi:lactoylglutathione lyase
VQLAKPALDVGLFTNQREAALAFWHGAVGLASDHVAKLGGGIQQHRHFVDAEGPTGSILKLNHMRDPLPLLPASGYRELVLARRGCAAPERLHDPDGNPVTLVPPGHDGVEQLAVLLRVSNRDAFDRFYRHALGLVSLQSGVYACGRSQLHLREEAPVERAADWRGRGFRYLTIQVFDAETEHAGILARGGEEGMAPVVLGDTARFSFVRDPDGNFLEISQRASLTGGRL